MEGRREFRRAEEVSCKMFVKLLNKPFSAIMSLATNSGSVGCF